MTNDNTGLGILISIIGCAIFALYELYKKKDLDVTTMVLVFLAIFAVTAGIELIYAALKGNPNALPSSWREYLAVSGMTGIGLSIKYIITVVTKAAKVESSVGETKNS